jgi:hypothetical protein
MREFLPMGFPARTVLRYWGISGGCAPRHRKSRTARAGRAQVGQEAGSQMNARILGALVGVGLGGFWASGAMAQESPCVSAKTAWSVCLGEQPKECWGVSKPTETVNTRDGQPVSVRRGDILLFVTFRPGTGAKGEVSFTGGYPFAEGQPVKVDIDGKSFDLVADGEWAWPGSAADDSAILTALKAGNTAVVTARSGRGTQTRDTFSLSGFTAAMTEAEARCK